MYDMKYMEINPNTNPFNHVVVVRLYYLNIHRLSPMVNHVQSLQDFTHPITTKWLNMISHV